MADYGGPKFNRSSHEQRVIMPSWSRALVATVALFAVGKFGTAAVKNVNIPGMREVSPVEMAQNVPLPRKSWPISAEKRCSSDLDASSLSAWSLTSVCGGSERLALRTHPVLR